MISVFDNGPFAPPPVPFNMAAHTLGQGDPDGIALETLAAPGRITESWTRAALRDAVLRAAGGLASLGITRGDRVLLRLGNSSDFPILFFAANALGAVPVPTSAQLTAAEITRIHADLDPRLTLLDPALAPPDGGACLAPRDIPAAAPVAFADTHPDDPAYMIYTSGTGGRPKGVVHAQRAAWARRMMWDGWYGLTPRDRVMHAGAFNWTYTLGAGLTDPWAIGATALIYTGPPDRDIWPALAAAHRPTIFAGAPGVYRQMLSAPDLGPGFATLRHGLSAGEALPDPVAAAWSAATGKPIYTALGMSEISTYISFSPTSPPVPGRAGRPQPGRRLAIFSDEGTPVPRGEPGLLAVSRRDPGLMLGYRGRDVPFTGEWFLTGDRAILHDDDTVAYLGRADDLMNAGGYRVEPLEVEAALHLHPGILEAAVAEREIRPGVTIIAAFYVPRADPVPEADLAAHCATHLARYKCPRSFTALPSLPRGANGKLLRRGLGKTPNS